jgi:hypothetical protein
MRNFLKLLMGVILATGCAQHTALSHLSNWAPPQNPNPESILDEAEADSAAGRYANSLAKFVWFFENAVKYDPALSGVRVSYALGGWEGLGESYPPALEKLKTVRDEAAQNARQEKDSISSFNDFASINSCLKDNAV